MASSPVLKERDRCNGVARHEVGSDVHVVMVWPWPRMRLSVFWIFEKLIFHPKCLINWEEAVAILVSLIKWQAGLDQVISLLALSSINVNYFSIWFRFQLRWWKDCSQHYWSNSQKTAQALETETYVTLAGGSGCADRCLLPGMIICVHSAPKVGQVKMIC